MASPSSTMRWSTRPESVITTSNSRAGVNATTSRCRTVDVDSVGYWTIATCRVSWANSRTARRSTSSRSTPDSRKERIALRPVDELAVALLGGHTARTGVRLGDVPLGLQHRHVIAHRRAGDAEIVPLDECLRPDRLLGGHEVGNDRAQHLKAAVVGATHLLTCPFHQFSLHFTVINLLPHVKMRAKAH